MATFREVAYRFTGEARGLEQTLRSISEHVRRVPQNKKIHISAKTAQARKELESIDQLIEELDVQTTDVRVTADIRDLALKIAVAKQMLARLPDDKTVNLKARDRISTDLARVNKVVFGVARDAERLAKPIKTVTDSLDQGGSSMGSAFGRASLILRRIPPLLSGITVALIAGVLPGIAALVVALAGAAAGVAALGTALVAAMGPAAILVIAIMQRLQKVLEVRKLRQQAANQEGRKGATIARRQAQAEQQLHAAGIQVRDSRVALARAEAAVGEARQRAREELEKARDDEADAVRDVTSAQQELVDATVDAGREMADAYEAASDAARGLQHAQLGLERSKLSLDQAKLALETFRKEAKLGDDALDGLFKKFSDVHFRFDAGGLEQLRDLTDGKLDQSQMLELRDLILDVQDAQLGVKDATDDVSDSQRDEGRAISDANKFRRQGIGASSRYQGALENLRTATVNEAKAAKTLRDLEKLGIKHAPGVVSAVEAETDARRALKEIRGNLRDTILNQKTAEDQVATSTELADQKTKDLSKSEQNLLDVIDKVSAAFKNTLGPATDDVLGRVAANLGLVTDAVPAARRAFQNLGKSWGAAVDKISANALRPDNVLAYGGFVSAGGKLSTLFSDIFDSLYNTAVNIAESAMPLLIEQVGKVRDAFNGWAAGTENIQGVRDALAPAMDTIDIFVGAIGDMGRILFGAFEGANKPINDFFGGLGKSLKRFADFANSAKGKNKIKDFFDDTLPAVRSMIDFLFKIGKTIVLVVQIALPIIKPLIDTFNGVLDVVNFLLTALNYILGPFKTLIGYGISLFFWWGKVGKIFDLIKLAFGGWRFLLGRALRPVFDLARGISTRLGGAFDFVARLFRGTRILNLAKALPGKILDALSALARFITSPFRKGLSTIEGLWGRFRSIGRRIVDALKAPWRSLSSFFSRTFESVLGTLRGAINRAVVDPINFVLRALNKIKVKVPDWIPGFGGKEFGFNIGQVRHLASGGVTSGPSMNLIGEAGREAVLPLRGPVLASVARAIVSAMQVVSHGSAGGLSAPFAGLGGGDSVTHVNVALPPAPAAAVPDARYQAVQLGRELSRRGFA